MDDLQSLILAGILARARSKMPQLPIDPKNGLDSPPVVPQPVIPVVPWTLKMGGNEATLSLPTNKGSNFEGYLNYSFNPFSPGNMGINGGGLRYRFQY